MNVFRYDDTSLGCVGYVKTVLPLIGNISSFQVYFEDHDIPNQYRDVADVDVYKGEVSKLKSTYLFIARNDKEDTELWLTGCTCGYGGTGPSTTQDVLELLGVKMDYSRIYKEKKIIEKDIITNHDLNFIVYHPSKENPYQAGEKCLKVTATFDYPDQKWHAKKALMSFGKITPLKSVERKANRYFSTTHSTEKAHLNYSTNYGLILRDTWSEISEKVLMMAIEEILKNYEGNCKIEKIEESSWFKI